MALVAHWKCDDASGGLVDSAGSNNLTANGSPTYAQTGQVDTAVQIPDGSYFNIVDNAALSLTGSVTFGGWVRVTSFANGHYGGVIAKVDGSDNGYALFHDSDVADPSSVFVRIGSGGTNGTKSVSAALATNTWKHLVGRFDSAAQTIDLFIDGVKQSSATSYTAGLADNANDLLVGKWRTVAGLTGKLDDLFVYNEALSDEEILSIFEAGVTAHVVFVPRIIGLI